MRPAPFVYFAPRTMQEVRELLAEHAEDCRLLAGGQSLMPLMNLRIARPAALIDLNRVEGLDHIALDGDELVFGPMVRQRDAENAPLVRKHCPLIAQGLHHAGPATVRNRATVGGTLAHADRTAELPGVAVALDATFVVEGRDGRRTVPAEAFFLGDLTTAVEPGEMLAEVRFPAAMRRGVSIFLEAGTRQRDMTIAGVGAWFDRDGERCREARIAAVGVGPTPVRLRRAEAAVVADGLGGRAVAEAVREDIAAIDFVSDVHASAAFRAHLVVDLVGRAVAAAAEGATG